MKEAAVFAWSVWLLATATALAQSREEKVRGDRQRVEAEGFWIYNDLPRGLERARETGKPLLVVLRCIPCVECVKLDDELVDKHPRVRPLLEEFVCVRIVATNGLDLSLFQFDTDQSFAAFLLNADGAIYGRFGTRSHRVEWTGDVSIDGLAVALEGALELHRNYPANRAELAAKRGPAPDVASPEKYPLLSGKYDAALHYEGNVVASCIHCHQIGDAQRQFRRDRDAALPESLVFAYPHPKALGLILDPDQRATVLRIEPDTPAEQCGLRPGDMIEKLGGQPLLSIADVQWVLHNTSDHDGSLPLVVRRGEQQIELALALPAGWRRRGDISWRASSWPLRRMVTGGLLLESLSALERGQAGLSAEAGALRVKHVGQFGPHAAAKAAGFVAGDIVVAYDGHSEFQRETDLLAYALTQRKTGDRVAVVVLRSGQRVELSLPIQP